MVFLARCVAASAALSKQTPAPLCHVYGRVCRRVCAVLRAQAALRVEGCARWLLVMGVMAASGCGWAQGPVDGAIRGHVAAVCGSSYPRRCAAGDVRVHVTSPDQGVERDVDADSEGDFLLLRLPPGRV